MKWRYLQYQGVLVFLATSARRFQSLLVRGDVPHDELSVDAAARDDVRLGRRELERHDVVWRFEQKLQHQHNIRVTVATTVALVRT